MFRLAFSEIADFGQRLDTPLVGEAYLDSIQKERLDRYGAKVLMPIALSLGAIARLAVWQEDGGPTTIGLTRVGKDGVPFEQRKIRSMVRGSESVIGLPQAKAWDDARITRRGRFIRRWSIDELLQVYNVKNGEMSLVSPRPKTPEEFSDYGKLDPDFKPAYTATRPGLTGLEQINGRAKLSPSERIELTKEYAAGACLAMDRDIILKTASAVFTGNGAC
jgi:lipopolysaccharide/colanic/teichoic acid biosynthesis glycosyltransferase